MDKPEIFYWQKLPNRDQALEVIYGFLRALSEKNPAEAAKLVQVKDMKYFLTALHDSLLKHLEMVVEDENWEEYEGKNLSMEIDDPANLDENLTMPEFTGRHFDLGKEEGISVQLGLRSQVTPIRLHFGLSEHGDGTYFIKLQRITAE
jgi:hypothetical protein